jgi:2-hydroxy-3-keto-5-methylthiopentenyl-1-phosphate phosphatase
MTDNSSAHSPRSLVPPSHEAQVWIDFDGTITRLDVLDELIRAFAVDDSWKAAEQQWQEGSIGSRECLGRQFAVVRATDADLDRFLDAIPVDDGVFPLIRLLDRVGVRYAVLSDGIDRFIRHLFRRHGLEDVTVRSNTIERPLHDSERMALRCPHGSEACESAAAHCKCASMEALARKPARNRRRRGSRGGWIYTGDGRSDLCPSRKCDCVFAKGVLSVNLEREGIPFLPYSTLHDVTDMLATVWGVGPEPA